MHNFIHVQIKVTDLDKAIDFYKSVFGWHAYLSKDMENYAIYQVDEEGDQLGGGFILVDEIPKESYLSVYIYAENIEETLTIAEQNGGKTILKKTPLPGSEGNIARMEDCFGNVLGLWSEN